VLFVRANGEMASVDGKHLNVKMDVPETTTNLILVINYLSYMSCPE